MSNVVSTIQSMSDLKKVNYAVRGDFLQAWTRELAAALGAPWSYRAHVIDPCRAFIDKEDDDDCELVIIYPPGTSRFRVIGACSSDSYDFGVLRYDERAPEIGVDPFRPMDKIAADVKRRLLPSYEALLFEVRRHLETRKLARQVQLDVAVNAAKVLGVELSSERLRQDDIAFHSRIGRVIVHPGGELRIHLETVPPALAIDVIRALAAAWPKMP